MQAQLTMAPGRPNRGVALAPITYTASSSSTTMLAANSKRSGLVLMNLGGKKCSIAFGSHAAVYESGIYLDKGKGVFVLDATFCTSESIQIITENGTSEVAIQEFERSA